MRPHKGKRENCGPRDDPDNPFHATNILFHDSNLLRYCFGCPAFTPRLMLAVRYQRRERMSVTLSQRSRGTTDESHILAGRWTRDDRSLGSLGRWTHSHCLFVLRPSSLVGHHFRSVMEFRES